MYNIDEIIHMLDWNQPEEIQTKGRKLARDVKCFHVFIQPGYAKYNKNVWDNCALIIADKTDVRRNRVRTVDKAKFDIHDRVNYAVTDTKLKINLEKKVISLNLQIDESICTMYEYFDIFLNRMIMCRGAAEILGAKFKLMANGSKVL